MDIPSINKTIALEKLHKARRAHIAWRANAQALVSGMSINIDQIPIDHTSCEFGIWYHGEGKDELCHLSAYDSIYAPHEMLHEIYKRIYTILHSKDAGNGGMDLAKNYLDELIAVSETLLQSLDTLEQEIQRLPEK
jgi:hypothetical protein